MLYMLVLQVSSSLYVCYDKIPANNFFYLYGAGLDLSEYIGTSVFERPGTRTIRFLTKKLSWICFSSLPDFGT